MRGMCTAFGEWYRKETQKILNEKENSSWGNGWAHHIDRVYTKCDIEKKGVGRKRICAVVAFRAVAQRETVRGGGKTRRVKQIHNVLARPGNEVCLMISQSSPIQCGGMVKFHRAFCTASARCFWCTSSPSIIAPQQVSAAHGP